MLRQTNLKKLFVVLHVNFYFFTGLNESALTELFNCAFLFEKDRAFNHKKTIIKNTL